jgi:hypothetical protein
LGIFTVAGSTAGARPLILGCRLFKTARLQESQCSKRGRRRVDRMRDLRQFEEEEQASRLI